MDCNSSLGVLNINFWNKNCDFDRFGVAVLRIKHHSAQLIIFLAQQSFSFFIEIIFQYNTTIRCLCWEMKIQPFLWFVGFKVHLSELDDFMLLFDYCAGLRLLRLLRPDMWRVKITTPANQRSPTSQAIIGRHLAPWKLGFLAWENQCAPPTGLHHFYKLIFIYQTEC